MKKIAIAVAAGALLLTAAVPASAATTAAGSSSVTAEVADTLEATFPAAYAWGSLNAGAAGNESAEQVLNVKSNQTWGVRISSDIADGRMTEWDGAAYVLASPLVLTNPLNWRLSNLGGSPQATSFAAISSSAADVVTGEAITASTDVGVTYRQVISYADSAAAGANNYRLLVNYGVQQGW